LFAGAVETARVAAGVAAAVEEDSAGADFFERLFFGAAALLSADAGVLAAESSAAAAFFDLLLDFAVSEDDAEEEESAASLLLAEADFFERLFLGAGEVELSAVAFSSAAADFLVVLFFFEDAVPVSADACEDEASAEAVSAFFFFLAFFLVESVWLSSPDCCRACVLGVRPPETRSRATSRAKYTLFMLFMFCVIPPPAAAVASCRTHSDKAWLRGRRGGQAALKGLAGLPRWNGRIML
jgi:hypothetical protein